VNLRIALDLVVAAVAAREDELVESMIRRNAAEVPDLGLAGDEAVLAAVRASARASLRAGLAVLSDDAAPYGDVVLPVELPVEAVQEARESARARVPRCGLGSPGTPTWLLRLLPCATMTQPDQVRADRDEPVADSGGPPRSACGAGIGEESAWSRPSPMTWECAGRDRLQLRDPRSQPTSEAALTCTQLRSHPAAARSPRPASCRRPRCPASPRAEPRCPPTPAAGRVHRPGNPGQHPAAATGDLIQRPPACGTDATGPNRRP
jgi:hypothetical protein